MTHWSDSLPASACRSAVEWARTQPDAATAWAVCERGDWMLWIAGYCAGKPWSEERRPLVLAACACAELALSLIEDENDLAVATSAGQTAQAWAGGAAAEDAGLGA